MILVIIEKLIIYNVTSNSILQARGNEEVILTYKILFE